MQLNNVISTVYFRIIRYVLSLKYIALITIFFGFIFPLNFSLASENYDQDYLNSYSIATNLTVHTIENKYKIIPEKLKIFNELNTFTASFSNPIVSTKDISSWDYQLSSRIINTSLTSINNNKKHAILANHLLMTGSLLNHNNFTADAIFDTARSILTNTISIPIQKWLHQFGTTSFKLNLDKNFSLHDSAVDLLIPFYNSKKNMLFTQWGIRNKDDRNTLNIGTGIRSYYANWMYGVNTFIDNDITTNNRRIDLGAEAWTNYLKFTANYYFGITNWHKKNKYINNERPANGYDIRAEGWLPIYPKLGGRIMTEKYFGDSVILSQAFNLKKNPQILTIGLNYTPIPLVTLSVDYHMAKGGKTRSSIGLQLTYHLGDSWHSHINPFAVTMPRTLIGNRYDLVERNNNIVVKYQARDPIQLSLPTRLSGISGQIINLKAGIISQNKLLYTTWKSLSLMSAGGNLVPKAPDSVAITLPPYKIEKDANNNYLLDAISYDLKNNISNKATVIIEVKEDSTKKNIITSMHNIKIIADELLTVVKDNAVADGLAKNLVKIKVKDIHHNPIPNYKVILAADNNTVMSSDIATTGEDGTVEISLSNIRSGTSYVTVQAGKITQKVKINFTAGMPSRDNSHTFVDSVTLPADGVSTANISVILKDTFDNPVTGEENNLRIFITPNKNFNYSPRVGEIKEVTPGSGIYSALVIAGISNGKFKIAPRINRTILESKRIVITPFVKISIPDANRHVFTANGVEEADIFVKVTNIFDRPVVNQLVQWRTNQGHSHTSETDKNGIARYAISTVRASENFIISAAVNNQNFVQSRSFQFKADRKTAKIRDFNIYRDNVKANGRESNIFVGHITDLYKNPVEVNVHFEIIHDKNFSREITNAIKTNIPGSIVKHLTDDSQYKNTGKLRAVITDSNLPSDWIKFHFSSS